MWEKHQKDQDLERFYIFEIGLRECHDDKSYTSHIRIGPNQQIVQRLYEGDNDPNITDLFMLFTESCYARWQQVLKLKAESEKAIITNDTAELIRLRDLLKEYPELKTNYTSILFHLS